MGTRLATEQWTGINRRYVYAPGEDTPLVWYEGSGTGDKRWLHADERGSVVAVSDASGAALAINRYDENGTPAAGNLGRFGYTGQQWIAGLGLWDYKNRMYSPALGRFMQTDPIGYGDGLNWYAYVGGDLVNKVDPLGLGDCPTDACGPEITAPGRRLQPIMPVELPTGASFAYSGFGGAYFGNAGGTEDLVGPDVTVIGIASQPPAPVPGSSRGPTCPTIQEMRANHATWVRHQVAEMRARGLEVATEVQMVVYRADGPPVLAVADIVARAPGTTLWQIHEIKTGNAGLTRNQEFVYNSIAATIRGFNGVPVGLKPGALLPLAGGGYQGVSRYPGCPR